jgi:hypothetical protein
LAGNGREAKNSQCHDPQSDKKFRRHCWQALQTFGNDQRLSDVLPVVRGTETEEVMTRLAQIGLAAALLLGGATFAMAQNGPPTGGYPPARWNPNFYGHYGYPHRNAYYPRYYAYYPVYPTVAGYWDYYRTSWPGRGNNEESTR